MYNLEVRTMVQMKLDEAEIARGAPLNDDEGRWARVYHDANEHPLHLLAVLWRRLAALAAATGTAVTSNKRAGMVRRSA